MGSISKASRNLFISQPSLSNIVTELEEELQFRIFDRGSNGVTLTSEGNKFMLSAKIILSEYNTIRLIPREIHENNLSICCTYSQFFMQAFMDFKNSDPKLGYQDSIRETGIKFISTHLLDLSNRLAFYYSFRTRSQLVQQEFEKYNLVSQRIAENVPLKVCMSNNNPLANRDVLAMNDLHDQKFIAFGGFEESDMFDLLGLRQESKPLIIYDRGGMSEFLIKEHYVSIMLPPLEGLNNGGLSYIQLDGLSDAMDVYCLYNKTYSFNSREKLFLSFIKKRLELLITQNNQLK